MVAPFEWQSSFDNDVPGIAKINTLEISANFVPNLTRIWSRAEDHPVPIDTVNVTIGQQSTLNALWITPRDEMRRKIDAMPELKYPYYRTVRFDTRNAVGDLTNPNQNVELNSQVINLTSIPHAIYAYVIRNESTSLGTVTSMTSPDVYFAPVNLSITWNNNGNILNEYRPTQLYDLCVKNGLRELTINESVGLTNDFHQIAGAGAVGKVGLSSAPVRIVPGEDFPLESDEAQGSGGNWSLQVQMIAKNINQVEALSAQLCILVVYEGYMALSTGLCRTVEGPVRPSIVENVKINESVSWKDLNDYYGGMRMGDRFKTFGKSLKSGLEKANKIAKETKVVSKGLKAASRLPTRASPLLQEASNLAESYGYGYGGQLYEGPVKGSKLKEPLVVVN